MAFTYDPSTDLGKARLALGDIEAASALFQDAEYTAMLTVYTAPLRAAAALADVLAARYGRMVSQSVDGASFSYGERARFFLELATRLRAQDANGTADALGTLFIGGISQGEIVSVEEDADRTPSNFKIGQNDDIGG